VRPQDAPFELGERRDQHGSGARRARTRAVGAGYSATAFTWGDASPVLCGMIGVRDVATRVPDLLPAQRLDQAPRALGGIQDRGDSGAAPSGECPASAGRPSSSVLGRPRPNQRAGPPCAHDLSPASVRHPGHAPALARRPDHTTMDHHTPTVRAPPTSPPLRR